MTQKITCQTCFNFMQSDTLPTEFWCIQGCFTQDDDFKELDMSDCTFYDYEPYTLEP